MNAMHHMVVRFEAIIAARTPGNRDRGATAVEYGIMVALIAIVIIVAVTSIGTNLSTLFNDAATDI